MARIDWVKYRLDNWALWKDRESRGGLGFATQSAFLNDAPDDNARESKIPVDEVDASVTDQAVESLKVPRPAIYQTLQLYYIKGIGVQGIMRDVGLSRSSVHSNLDQADRAIAVWFSHRADKQREAKKSFTP